MLNYSDAADPDQIIHVVYTMSETVRGTTRSTIICQVQDINHLALDRWNHFDQ